MIQRRLWFFEQHQMAESDRRRRFGSQFPRCRVKGCRYGQHHILFRQRGVGMTMIPGRPQVFQITDRSLQWRDPLHFLRRFDRQDRRPPIHAGMA